MEKVKNTDMTRPQTTDRTVTSGKAAPAGT